MTCYGFSNQVYPRGSVIEVRTPENTKRFGIVLDSKVHFSSGVRYHLVLVGGFKVTASNATKEHSAHKPGFAIATWRPNEPNWDTLDKERGCDF